MTFASKETYKRVVGTLGGKSAVVYELVKAATPEGFQVIAVPRAPQTTEENAVGRTMNEACLLLGWAYNTTSARFVDLADAGMIKESGVLRGRQTAWVAAPEPERRTLAAARRAAKRGVVARVLRHCIMAGDDGNTRVEVTVDLSDVEWMHIKNKRESFFR